LKLLPIFYSSDIFVGKQPAPMSSVYSKSYADASLNVGILDSKNITTLINTIKITSYMVRRLNGSYISAWEERIVPYLTSIASSSNKCFHYNLTAVGEPIKEFIFKLEYYKIGSTIVYGFLMLSNRARSTGILCKFASNSTMKCAAAKLYNIHLSEHVGDMLIESR
jgi:hypothetical protein